MSDGMMAALSDFKRRMRACRQFINARICMDDADIELTVRFTNGQFSKRFSSPYACRDWLFGESCVEESIHGAIT